MYLDYLLLVSLTCLCSATNNQCIAPAVHESRHPLRQIEAGRPLQLMAAAQTRSPCHATRPARGTGLLITNFKTIRGITIVLVAYLACWETSTEGCYTSDTSSQLPYTFGMVAAIGLPMASPAGPPIVPPVAPSPGRKYPIWHEITLLGSASARSLIRFVTRWTAFGAPAR